jgi:hypothetical protein
MNLGNYTVDDAGNRTATTSVEGFGGERSEFAKKMEELAKKQAAGAGLNVSAAVPKKSAYQLAMERLAMDQAKNAAANAGRGGPARPSGFKNADMAPIKYVGGPGIIGGPTMDVMAMNYEQRQKFLPQGSTYTRDGLTESQHLEGIKAGAEAENKKTAAVQEANAPVIQQQQYKAELWRRAMQGDPEAIRMLQGGV